MNDVLADTLTRIKNAVMRGKKEVTVKSSKLVIDVLEVLKTEGFVGAYETQEDGDVKVNLVYEAGEPMAASFIKVSRPGQRIYVGYKEIVPVLNGRGISIISTSQGVMTGAQAKSKKLGGEFLCKVW